MNLFMFLKKQLWLLCSENTGGQEWLLGDRWESSLTLMKLQAPVPMNQQSFLSRYPEETFSHMHRETNWGFLLCPLWWWKPGKYLLIWSEYIVTFLQSKLFMVVNEWQDWCVPAEINLQKHMLQKMCTYYFNKILKQVKQCRVCVCVCS